MADPLTASLEACARGDLPAAVAVMRLCMAAESFEQARAASLSFGGRGARLAEAQALLTRERFALVKRVLAEADHSAAADPQAWGRAFDRIARAAPDAGSALYALGDPGRLADATAEVVAWLDRRKLLAFDRRVLEIGCGSGRFLRALRDKVALVVGADVSQCMAVESVRRGGVAVRTDGRGLAAFADRAFDLVLAVDSWPYLVNAGLAERHLDECRRVLRPGGRLAVLNWSYDGVEPDARAVRGFTWEPSPRPEFEHWDVRSAYVLAPADPLEARSAAPPQRRAASMWAAKRSNR